MTGLEISRGLPTGDKLGSTHSVSPADWWEQSAHEVASDKPYPAAGQQLLPSQMLTWTAVPHRAESVLPPIHLV